MRVSLNSRSPLIFVAVAAIACEGAQDESLSRVDRAPQCGGPETTDPNGGTSAPPPPGMPPLPAGGCGTVKAFPTAEGFGAQARGGRGGRAIEVTSLADNGPGTLRACAEDTGPRTCVFRVAGTIELERPISVHADNSFLTIAAQTAPGEGVQLKNYFLSISNGAHDVIVRHLRVRPGTDAQPADINNDCGGILLYGPNGETVDNVMIDHSSVAWVCDDSVQAFASVTNSTFQWTLIAEGLDWDDYLSPASGVAAASKGFLSGGGGGDVNTVSFHHNMFFDTDSRNPAVGAAAVFDFRNNMEFGSTACTQNPSFGDIYNRTTNVNFVGNKYVSAETCLFGELWNTARLYVENNWTPFCANDCADPAEWNLGFIEGETNATTYEAASEAKHRVATPFPAPPITMTPLGQLEDVLTAYVGATRPARDALDARFVADFRARVSQRGRDGAPYPVLADGAPPADTDHDGIADDWESAHGLDASDPSDGPATAANGYTNLENYLNELAGDPPCNEGR